MLSFESVLSRFWWAVLLRGVVAIIFGIVVILSPRVTLSALILLFGFYAEVDGVAAIVLGITEYGDRHRWWSFLLGGVISVAAGVMAFVVPGLTAVALLSLIAFWALIRGVFDILSAIRLRQAIQGEWLLGLGGLLSVAFGVILLAFPGTGGLALNLWIGCFAILLGGVLFALSLRMRGLFHGARA